MEKYEASKTLAQHYQVNIMIIEGRHLAITNANTKIKLSIGKKKKSIHPKTNKTDSPFFNDFCTFHFFLPLTALLNEIVVIRVYQIYHLRKKLVGGFSVELSTVWAQPDHRFVNKWAVLMEPKNMTAGVKGFLKCDIAILAKEIVSRPIQSQVESDDILEDNLLVPEGGIKDRFRTRIVFSVFRADSFSSRFKNRPGLELPVRPYVRITYAGSVMKTNVARNKESPIWNEELTFFDLVPPLCQNILIEMCDRQKSFRKTSLGNSNINIANLYEDGIDGFFPTFGPSFIYLYRPFKKFERYKENVTMMQNSFTYFCRLLIAMRTEILAVAEDVAVRKKRAPKKISPKPIAPLIENAYFTYKKFVLFGVVFDVLLFDNKYVEKNITIRLTIGPKENAGELNSPEKSESKEIWENPLEKPAFLNVLTTCSATPNLQVTVKSDYSFMAFSGRFPCVHVYGEWPDSTVKMRRSNVIKKAIRNCEDEVEKVKDELELESSERAESTKKLKNVLNDLSKSCEVILLLTNVATLEETNLCKEKRRVYRTELTKIAKNTKSDSVKDELVAEDELTKISAYLGRLAKYSQDPENSFPDTEVWILRNGVVTSQFRVKTEDIVYSANFNERGIACGKIQTIAIRGKKEKIKAKLDIFLWFGLADDFVQCLKMLPSGFKHDHPNCPTAVDSKIPGDIIYEERHSFRCRAHIFQAKILVGFDQTGLADPFVRVIALGEARATQVRKGTLSPTWKETLVFPELTLYGPLDFIKENSITLTVEIFDREKASKSELIGRTFVKPVVKLSRDKNEPSRFSPKLKWEEVQREFYQVGKILMVTELLEISGDSDELAEKANLPLTIPENIMPPNVGYRLEILFWGVRQLRKKRSVKNKVFVTLECGEASIKSPTIKNVRHKLNFPGRVQYVELELPEEAEFAPPLTLKLFHVESLTRKKKYLANCIVPSIRKFYYVHPESVKTQVIVGQKIKKKQPEKGSEKKRRSWLLKKPKIDEEKLEKFLFGFVRFYRFCKCSLTKKCVGSAYESKVSPVREEETLDWWIRYRASVEDSNFYPDVPTFKIYQRELEHQPEFGGFTDFLIKFNMVDGRRKKNKEIALLGQVKAAVKVYKWPIKEGESVNGGYLSRSPSNEEIKFVVRAYIICAKNIAPKDVNGKSDPYLFLQLGSQHVSDRNNYSPKQLNPTFGKCFEFKGTFPHENVLRIKVIDYDASSRDDLIGETVIDIENRYYTKHHASCGLANNFEKEGFNSWRDIFLPTHILSKACKESDLKQPIYENDRVKIENYVFLTPIPEDARYREEIQALSVLHRWQEISPKGYHMVPEHLETRSLYHPSVPGIEQGKLEMWVDIFPADFRFMPPMVDVKPRPPVPMELRAIVWNVDNVVLDDKSFFFNEKMSDIYVRGWILSLEEDTQRTDTHYRSLNGEGNFNWRFIFHFNYIPTERMMTVKKKKNAFDVHPEERKHHCKLEIQIWDNDAFGDDYLGTLILELCSMPRGAKLSSRCTLKMLAPNAAKINLFKIGKTRGWWPFRRLKERQKVGNEFDLTGRIDLELEVLTETEAMLSPAGKGRDDPNGLPAPIRPATSFNWMLSPLKTLRYIVWKKFARCIILTLIILLVVFFFVVALYSLPNYLVKKLVGA